MSIELDAHPIASPPIAPKFGAGGFGKHETTAPATPLIAADIGPSTPITAAIIVPRRAVQMTKKSLKISGMYLEFHILIARRVFSTEHQRRKICRTLDESHNEFIAVQFVLRATAVQLYSHMNRPENRGTRGQAHCAEIAHGRKGLRKIESIIREGAAHQKLSTAEHLLIEIVQGKAMPAKDRITSSRR